MATRLSAKSLPGEERVEREFEELRSQVQREKDKVRCYFHQLHLLLAAREESVLRELDEIVERVRSELTEKRALLQQLNTAREGLERDLTENKLRELLQKNLRSLEDGMGEMLGGEGVTVGWVEVEWNVEAIEVSVSEVCKVVCLKKKPVQRVDYSVKVRHVRPRATGRDPIQDYNTSPRHISSLNHPLLVDDLMPSSHEASSQPISTDEKYHSTTPTSYEEEPFSHQTLEAIIQFHDKYACVVNLPQGGRYRDAQYIEQLNLKVVQCPSQEGVLTLIADNKELIKCALKKLSEKFGKLGYLLPCNGVPIMNEALKSFVEVDETQRQQPNKHKVLASLTCSSGIKIRIKHMKIDDGKWDAVLKPVDSNTISSTRLDNMSVTDVFGPNIIEKDSRIAARTAEKLENWHFFVVKSPKITYCKKLICLVVPGWNPTYFKGSHFKQSLTSVLEFCNKISMSSIAFPVIGHESKKIPIPSSAQALLQGIDDFSANIRSPNLRNIDIVISRDTQIRSFLYHFVTPIQNQINLSKYGKKLANPESVEEEEDRCSICLDLLSSDVDPLRQLTKCKHEFHESCITRAIEVNPMCPLCKAPLGIQLGNQPPRGTMSHAVDFRSLPGYPGVGSITIKYHVPGGIQNESHPNPGVSYMATNRTAFLPDNDKGRKVLNLLQLGFDRGLIFKVDTSRTPGIDNVITWNDIHHKTSISGPHGYPDEKYLDRVLTELKEKGVQ